MMGGIISLFRMLFSGNILTPIAVVLGVGMVYAAITAFKMAGQEKREGVMAAVKVSVISGGIAFFILPYILGLIGIVAGVWAGLQGSNAGWIGAGMSLVSLISGLFVAAMLA